MAKETTLNEIREMLAHVVEHMATKEDTATKEDVRDIRSDLSGLRKDLDVLAGRVDNIVGFRKEIDYAFDRIAAIEKKIGAAQTLARPPTATATTLATFVPSTQPAPRNSDPSTDAKSLQRLQIRSSLRCGHVEGKQLL